MTYSSSDLLRSFYKGCCAATPAIVFNGLQLAEAPLSDGKKLWVHLSKDSTEMNVFIRNNNEYVSFCTIRFLAVVFAIPHDLFKKENNVALMEHIANVQELCTLLEVIKGGVELVEGVAKDIITVFEKNK